MLKLIVEDDEGRKTVVPFVRDEMTIGRQEGNTIRLTERNVSRRHARLSRQNGHVSIEDLGSYNGIRVNGDRISGRVQVADGDLIQIGDYDLAIQNEEHVAAAPTIPLEPQLLPLLPVPPPPSDDSSATVRALPLVPDTPQAPLDRVLDHPDDDREFTPDLEDDDRETPTAESRRMPPEAEVEAEAAAGAEDEPLDQTPAPETAVELDPSEAPRLVVLNTDLAGREFACLKTDLTIGRGEENDIALDHRSLSRNHCRLVREASGEWRLVDLESANGILVNGEPYKQVTLRLDEVFELGHVKLQFLGPADRAATPSPAAAPPASTSRAPFFAVIAAVAVLVLGLGGYAGWKSLSSSAPRPQAVAELPPEARADARPAAPPSPDAPRMALDEKLAKARQVIANLDFGEGTRLLKECTLDGALAPQAEQLLTQLGQEGGNRTALEEAARLLRAGDEGGAKAQLDAASQTKLLKARYDELSAQLNAHVAAKLKRSATATGTAAAPGSPLKGRPDESEALIHQAIENIRGEKFSAAALQLERCIERKPNNYQCHKLYGSVEARIAVRDNSQSALARARRAYEKFLELAPPNDPDVPRVKGILEAADR